VEKDKKHEETRNHGNSLLVDVSAASAVPVDSLIATISPSLVLPRAEERFPSVPGFQGDVGPVAKAFFVALASILWFFLGLREQ